jgi:hypothetical protein
MRLGGDHVAATALVGPEQRDSLQLYAQTMLAADRVLADGANVSRPPTHHDAEHRLPRGTPSARGAHQQK